MAEAATNRNELAPELSTGQRLTRAAVGVLFYLILLIPRVRRLRRRVRLWTAVRVVAGLTGLGLGWLHLSGRSGWFLACAPLFTLFALLIRATPVVKSLEDRARELGALAVLNGGTMVSPPGEPTCRVNIFASGDHLTVENGRRTLLEIPLAKIQRCKARALEPGEGKPWELEITRGAPDSWRARFRFDGFFAEHLARVAETTIESLRRRELPVLKS